MYQIKHEKIQSIPKTHKDEQEGYEYYRQSFLSRNEASQCKVSIYEIPPLKSAYPYHAHLKDEEVFYIISGTGLLKTPQGEREVFAGELIYFPANREGAHKLTNTSETEILKYLDFDTKNDIDIAIYPDSDKIGIWGGDVNRLYKINENVEYYKDE